MFLFPLEFKDKQKETAFINYFDYQNRFFSRIGIILSTVGWSVFLVIFYFFYPEIYVKTVGLFLVFLAPLFAWIIFITYKKEFMHLYQPLTALANLLAGILIVYLSYHFPAEDWFIPFVFLLALILFAFFILRLRYRFAVITTLTYTLFYQLIFIYSPQPVYLIIISSLGLWMFEFSCIVGGYLLESLSRQIYLQNLKIKAQQEALADEREKSEKLLLNVLPASIAERLKKQEEFIADKHASVSVLFADIVNFTSMSQLLSAEEVVNLLNEIFSVFDNLVEKYNLEKIKTIGDAYMVVAGIAPGQTNHIQDTIDLAVDMISATQNHKSGDIKIRVGIHTGSAVAGIIGKKKFLFDLWGDTVNTASRMESYGLPDCIQIAEETFEIVKDIYPFSYRGIIDVKGKGGMKTYIYNPVV